MKSLIPLFLLKIVLADISIKADYDDEENVKFVYSGTEEYIVADEDINLFTSDFPKVLNEVYGKQPDNYYFKSPTPWGDLYKTYNWEQVKKNISVYSASVTGVNKRPVVVLTHNFENDSNSTVKVNTAISRTVQNTIKTSWSRNKEIAASLEISCEIDIIIAQPTASASYSYKTTWGSAEEQSLSETIGATSSIEIELKPGQAVVAVLSANAGTLDLEVVYQAHLKGQVAVNFEEAEKGHHFYGPHINGMFEETGVKNEVTITEKIQFGFYADATLKVHDKQTGQVMLQKVF